MINNTAIPVFGCSLLFRASSRCRYRGMLVPREAALTRLKTHRTRGSTSSPLSFPLSPPMALKPPSCAKAKSDFRGKRRESAREAHLLRATLAPERYSHHLIA
jgi:hypothetical protein